MATLDGVKNATGLTGDYQDKQMIINDTYYTLREMAC